MYTCVFRQTVQKKSSQLGIIQNEYLDVRSLYVWNKIVKDPMIYTVFVLAVKQALHSILISWNHPFDNKSLTHFGIESKCWFENGKNLKKSSYNLMGMWLRLRLKECLWCSFNIKLWSKCKDTHQVVTNFYEKFQLLNHRGRWRRINKEFIMIGHRSQESSMTSAIAIIESVWLRPFKRLPYCPNLVWHVALYLQKEQEDSLRKKFRMTTLELA